MIRVEPLTLDHQRLLHSQLKCLALSLSEYNFSNIYLYRKLHLFEVVFVANKIYIKGNTRDDLVYYMPTEVPEWEDLEHLAQQLQAKVVFFPIPDRWLDHFPQDKCQRDFLEADSDYLYTLKQIQEYPGRGLAGQRNLVKQFRRNYSCEVVSLDDKSVADAITLLNRWKKPTETDYESCLEGLQLYQQLHLEGRVYYVNRQPIAFVLGEPLNATTYLLHSIKADTAFHGIYPFVYQEYALSLSPSYEYLNMEQDLGVSGLRQAKRSYHPCETAKKWRIHF
jgi:hypothetical protein